MSSRHRTHDPRPAIHGSASAVVAAAYNQSGADYITYADGDPTDLFAFGGLHAYADRRIWALLETKLRELRATGASSIGILDAGWPPWCIAGRTAHAAGSWLPGLILRQHKRQHRGAGALRVWPLNADSACQRESRLRYSAVVTGLGLDWTRDRFGKTEKLARRASFKPVRKAAIETPDCAAPSLPNPYPKSNHPH